MAKRSWDILTEERRQECEKIIIDVLGREYDLKVGIILAGGILDVVLQTVGTDVYNKGVEDARIFVANATENLDWDIKGLLR